MTTIRLFVVSFFCLFASLLSAQNFQKPYEGVLSQLYFQRQPDPKSEAMGRGLVANSDAEFGSYYNPALTSLASGVNFNLSHTYQHTLNSDYDYIGISYNSFKTGGFSISKYNWAFGRTDGDNARFHNSIHTLNYSRDIGKEYYAGVNVNLVHMGYVRRYMFYEEGGYDQKSSDAFSVDLGFLKKIVLDNGEEDDQVKIFQIGAALYNVSGTAIANNNGKDIYEALPIILRMGVSYNFKLLGGGKEIRTPELQSFTHFEYESILNDGDVPLIKLGEELIVSDFLILRAGLVSSGPGKSYSSDYFEPAVTFGAGFKIGVSKFLTSADRATFVLDYAGTPPASINNNFNLFSLKVNYIP